MAFPLHTYLARWSRRSSPALRAVANSKPLRFSCTAFSFTQARARESLVETALIVAQICSHFPTQQASRTTATYSNVGRLHSILIWLILTTSTLHKRLSNLKLYTAAAITSISTVLFSLQVTVKASKGGKLTPKPKHPSRVQRSTRPRQPRTRMFRGPISVSVSATTVATAFCQPNSPSNAGTLGWWHRCCNSLFSWRLTDIASPPGHIYPV